MGAERFRKDDPGVNRSELEEDLEEDVDEVNKEREEQSARKS